MEINLTSKHKLAFPNATSAYIDLLETWKSKARPVVIWAGAGLSAPAGLPSWPTLQNRLASEASKYVNSLSVEQQRDKRLQLLAITSKLSPWLAFEKLEQVLGQSNFEAEVRRALSPALKSEIPDAYLRLWKLGVKGFLTLNIDRLTSRAFTEAQPSELLVERSGFDVKALIGSINSADRGRFVANLHGSFEDPTTWVFTESRRKALFADQRYQEFVRDVLKYCTVVLLGVSAHDVAVRDHLSRLKADGIRGDQIFWVSSETGNEALRLAEESGIRFVSYRNADGAHDDLNKFFEDILSFNTTLVDAPPIVSESNTSPISNFLPDITEILVMSPNEQRAVLNSHASSILSSESEDNYLKFEEFCKNYNRGIHASGLLDTEAGYDRVLDYTLTNLEDNEGGFGTIWRAVDGDGNQVAIKVFKHEIRKNQNLLKAFRRGVRSLKILAKHNLPGIIEFKAACEIPPVLVMEWIEGVNLFEAVNQGKFHAWESRLRVAYDLATVIYSAHSVPERVFHRDIKPQNIMFRDFYQEGEMAELVVLDFDLSWHVGALEKSVLAKGANPYLAPEQLLSQTGMTSRSAAVDAYGFGMTLYFLCTSTVPTPFMHQSAEWPHRLESIAKQSCKPWRSAPRRISRLIDACTKHDQNLRPSFSQIAADVTRLLQIVRGEPTYLDASLICEELAARVETLSGYKVWDDGTIYWKSHTQRLRTTMRPNVKSDGIYIKFEFIQVGNEQFHALTNASDQISKAHTHFPAATIEGSPIFTAQHGHYINEMQLTIQFIKVPSQIDILGKAISLTMDKLMGASL